MSNDDALVGTPEPAPQQPVPSRVTEGEFGRSMQLEPMPPATEPRPITVPVNLAPPSTPPPSDPPPPGE